MISNRLYKICSLLLVLIMFFNIFSVYALNIGPQKPSTGTVNVNNVGVVKTVKNLWSTISVIVQILSVAAIVFTGLRYMFASADGRADIKNQTIILVIGAVLVFGAVEIADLIYDAANNIIKQ